MTCRPRSCRSLPSASRAAPDVPQGVSGDAFGEERVVFAERVEHRLSGATGEAIHDLQATFVPFVAERVQRVERKGAQQTQPGSDQSVASE